MPYLHWIARQLAEHDTHCGEEQKYVRPRFPSHDTTPASKTNAIQCIGATAWAVSVVLFGISPLSSKRRPRSAKSAVNIHSS